MKKKSKIIIILIAIIAIIGISVGGTFAGIAIHNSKLQKKYAFTPYQFGSSGDRIHFLGTSSSDAILLESNGNFAMIDCAEDSDNPRGFKDLELTGHEVMVINYIKKVASNSDGKVVLDFILGTHSHSDHIGGFDTLLLDNDITVNRAYLKRYNEAIINENEIKKWDNLEVYNQMVNACNAKGVELIQDLPTESFALGNLSIKIFNGAEEKTATNLGENENSLGVLVEKNGITAFLSGDINNIDGDEDRLAELLGKVNLLKIGHHGHSYSTTKNFVKTLNPDLSIVTNYSKNVNRKSASYLRSIKCPTYGTLDNNGIVAQFNASGFSLYKNLHI